MPEILDEPEASELLHTLDELAAQQNAIEQLRLKLIAAKCKDCERFGAALRTIRKRHGVTQGALSLALGYQHASKVNKWEAAKEFPRRDELIKMIETLHCRREEAVVLGITWWCDPLRPGDYH